MIDDKEIDIAARAVVLSKHINETAYFQLRSIEDFKDGAKWALKEFLKDLWHPAEEEPQEKDKLLMVETGKKEHKYVHFKRNQGCLFGGWKQYAHMVDVTRWLYMDDLNPKN